MELTLDLSTVVIAEHAHDSCLRIDALAPILLCCPVCRCARGAGCWSAINRAHAPVGHTAPTWANDCGTTMYGPPLAGSGHVLAGGAFIRYPRDRGLSDTI